MEQYPARSINAVSEVTTDHNRWVVHPEVENRAACVALIETFGIGALPAAFRKIASSISNHSCRQSVEIGVVAVAIVLPLQRRIN